jgi:hypothetical protein
LSDNPLVVINSNPLALGGVGLGSSLFKARPATIQLVPKTTRQDNAIPGTFRNISTGERVGTLQADGSMKDEIRAVLLAEPQQQREWYLNDGKTYSKEMKQCFSVDNIQPHRMAKNPPAMFCSTCPKGDINWQKWREGGKTPNLLPPCQMFWHLFIAERTTQSPYYLNVTGKSVTPFEQAMKTQMAGLFAKIIANATMINKARGYKLNRNTGLFEFVGLPEGVTEQLAPEPLPNIFDIVFTIYANKKDGEITMGFKDFARMKPEDREEFGSLYAEFLASKKQAAEQKALPVATEEQQGNAAVTEAMEGEYVDTPAASTGKDEPITI